MQTDVCQMELYLFKTGFSPILSKLDEWKGDI